MISCGGYGHWFQCCLLILCYHVQASQHFDLSRSITVLNECGVTIDVLWVHPETGETDHSNTNNQGFPYGGELFLNTHVGHSFQVQELPNQYTRKCRKNNPCRSAQFTVSRNQDQVFTVWKNFSVTAEDHRTRAMTKAQKTVQTCLEHLKNMETMVTQASDSLLSEDLIRNLTFCMDREIQMAFRETEEEIAFQADLRTTMGRDFMNYACRLDNGVPAPLSYSYKNETWDYLDPTTKTTVEYNIQTLLETSVAPSSNAHAAWLVENFVSEEQCRALERYAEETTSHPNNKNATNDSIINITQFVSAVKVKSDLLVVQLLLKVQNLVENLISRGVPKFGSNDEPVMIMQQRQRRLDHPTPYDNETCSSQEEEKNGQAQCLAEYKTDRNFLEMQSLPSNSSGTIIFFCSSNGGALHFPKTGVHIPAHHVVGGAFLISHGDDQPPMVLRNDTAGDTLMGEYAFCLPQKPGTGMTVFMSSFHLEQDDDDYYDDDDQFEIDHEETDDSSDDSDLEREDDFEPDL